ncbi:hypothetical protein K4A83_16310 [Spirulina subsalsa FACHB-351]|uniref:CoA-binding domain-containing protein n=1 Tax=Spirulina subsalsa FACHB-351 TaxID=234711 RepID=A0ABT3L8K4_9CYAN|nr:hypothetical protein [Spirulina subsalsa]MCW6037823.1 hypothetical protein [Spirulina subsalsa FACHB-351]
MQIDDTALSEILTHTQTIALIGYSNKPHRDSYRVVDTPRPKGTRILGSQTRHNLAGLLQPG